MSPRGGEADGGLDGWVCHRNVAHMKTTTIRELKHDMTAVLARVTAGETVEVRRRGEPVAVLSAPRRKRTPVRPDFAARLKKIYGGKALPGTATELIAEARGER